MLRKVISIVSLIAALVFTNQVLADSIQVHTRLSKLKIAEIATDTEYSRVQEDGKWMIVRFFDPIIPVWVSADFVSSRQGSAVVVTDRLNMRLSASKDSPILASVARGYRSEILATKNNFVQIKAPTWLPFAIAKSSARAAQNKPVTKVTAADSGNRRIKRLPSTLPKDTSETVSTETAAETRSTATTIEESKPRSMIDVASQKPVAGGGAQLESSATKVSAQNKSPSGDISEVADVANDIPTKRMVSSSELQHRLSPGDTISLIVFGEPDLSASNLRIPQSGLVSFPLIGSVPVAGQTTKEVEEIVRDTLSGGFVRNPRLTVSIDSYRPIFILGEVHQIGSFPYSEGLTVAKALATAGGAKNSALANGVSISRDGEKIASGLSLNSEFQILSGDIISVTEEQGVAGEAAFYVYLHGEVASPGEYQFRRGLTVEKAIVLAGGFTLRASRRRIAITRITEESETPVKLKKVPLHMAVEPGDIIDVGASWF